MSRPPALVLTAGLGTRLRPLTGLRAKAAVPVNGEALAHRVARWLRACGILDQVFNLHHHPATIAAALGDGAALGVRLRYSWENPVLGSAGGPRHALPLLIDRGDERFLIVNGDTLTDVDLDALLETHQRSGALVTMALIRNPAPDKYGGVTVSADAFVTGFTPRGSGVESFHFVGVQVAEARTFATLPDHVPHESVNRLYPDLMRVNSRSVGAFVADAGFRDIGTPADYLHTSIELARAEGDRLVSPAAKVSSDAVLKRTVVWDDVTVDRGVHLTDCVIGDGVRVPEGANYSECTIVPAGCVSATPNGRIDGDLLITPL